MGINRWIASLACVLLLVQLTVRAQTADWSALDTSTRELLASWRANWSTLDPNSRAQLLANAKRWLAMDATARAGFMRRNVAWQALPPLERARQRARYAAWRALPADAQTQVRAAAARLAALPAAQQSALRGQFAALDADRQRAWLLGPSTGGWIEQARQLFAYVPVGEREATLDMLRTLPADARAQLFALASKMPDDRREQLRRQLLAADPAQRPALLRQRPSQ